MNKLSIVRDGTAAGVPQSQFHIAGGADTPA
jgi:hypothetical protein